MARFLAFLSLFLVLLSAVSHADDQPAPLRAGIIGLDTSHVEAFTEVLNNPKNTGDLAGVRVVAAYPGGSPDLPASIDRVEGYTKKLRDKFGVEIVDSIDTLLTKVDVVLLESVDGRPHLKQLMPVLKAGKICFIDKPVAGALADALRIYDLARKYKVPIFSASSLRFSPGIARMRHDPKVGKVVGCMAYGPCHLEEHHPDLFWYGIHGVEALFTIMGTGCQSVSRTHTDTAELVTGVWNDGRIGTFRGIHTGKSDYGALVFGTKGIAPSGAYGGYKPLLVEICKFFKTRRPPVSAEETIEIFAFMEAADESKRQGGKPVTLESVMEKARRNGPQDTSTIEESAVSLQGNSKEDAEEDFVSMFNGKDFTGWRFSGGRDEDKVPKNWKVEDGMIQLLGDGSPHLASRREYQDFDLRLQWRAHKKGYNSGLYVRSGRKVNINQINLAQTDAGHLMSKVKGGKAVPALQNPPGQWNDWRVLAVGDRLTLWCNGKLAWEVTGFKPARGYIGLQAEGAAIDFKNIRIKELSQ
jgi:3-keto-disaccharide hydrolase/Oxidoreductase family, NAD-binding Rossmann fold